MCQPNCRHSKLCAHNDTGLNCDLNNDAPESLCSVCIKLVQPKKENHEGSEQREVPRKSG